MAQLKKKNICPTDDLFNRYKRDILQVVYEKKHGGQTRITNLNTIAAQLHTDFQKQLKMPVKNATLRGKIEVDKLKMLLEKFIGCFILCQNCGLPELGEKGVCRACGEK